MNNSVEQNLPHSPPSPLITQLLQVLRNDQLKAAPHSKLLECWQVAWQEGECAQLAAGGELEGVEVGQEVEGGGKTRQLLAVKQFEAGQCGEEADRV